MCAVFGILGSFDEDKAKKSTKILSHRGESQEVLRDKNIYLSHNLFAINSLDTDSIQPLKYKNLIVLFNGEIYNYRELICKFNLEADSEVMVIAKLFDMFGVDMVLHLVGMFAIAIVEAEKLYLFRDRLGKKPLFYSKTSNSFIFSSEIKAIKAHIDIKLNQDALLSYLSFLAPLHDLTFFENIHKLPPASYLIYDGKSFFVKRYFDILDISTQIYDKKMALDEIELALIDSISNRLSSSREIGSLLSGGIDSSLICSIVSKEFGKSLKTFSIGYDGFEKYDERGYAKLVAESINSEHYEFNFTYDNFLEYINSTLYALDEPINDPASIPLHFLFKSVKTSGIDVLLSGEGSDELFFGYRQYFEFFDIEKLSNLKFKNWLNGYFKKNFSLNREWEWYKRIFEGSYLFRSSAENFTDLQKAILLQRDIKDNSSLKYIEPYIKEFEESIFKGDALSWYSYIDLKVLVNDIYLAKVDRVSMSNTLEVRTPFLDHNLVQKVLSIDSKLRLGDRTKTLLKDISSKYLPDIIINRKKKGFSYPFLEWLYMAGEIDRISQINKKTDIFNSDKLKFLLESGKKGKFKQHIFGIYLFSIFFEKEFL